MYHVSDLSDENTEFDENSEDYNRRYSGGNSEEFEENLVNDKIIEEDEDIEDAIKDAMKE